MMETFVEFTFDAAHRTTPDTPLHGHTFFARVYLTGERHPQYGWSHDLLEVRSIIHAARDTLDNTCLNDIEGFDFPTLENITAWIWDTLFPRLCGLQRVELRRGPAGHAEGCVYAAPASPVST